MKLEFTNVSFNEVLSASLSQEIVAQKLSWICIAMAAGMLSLALLGGLVTFSISRNPTIQGVARFIFLFTAMMIELMALITAFGLNSVLTSTS